MSNGPDLAELHVVVETNVVVGPDRVEAARVACRGKMVELPMRSR